MKASNYNFFFAINDEGNFLAYNALRNSLTILPETLVKLLQSIKAGDKLEMVSFPTVEKLKKGGFICDDHFDEYSMLVVRRHIQQYSNSNRLGLTVAPSLYCNLSCSYCFESHQNIRMNQMVITQLVEWVQKKISEGLKSLSIIWYGGEPLISLDIIEDLSRKWIEICQQNGVQYTAYVITNGTQYTREKAEKLKTLQVNEVQITLDGDKEHHDSRRPYHGGQGSFEQILTNIIETAGILPISLRVNIDNQNVNSALDFLKAFQSNPHVEPYFKKGNISIHYGHVRKFTASCRCSEKDCLQPGEFWQEELKLHQYLAEQGLAAIPFPLFGTGCQASTTNGYVVGPEGELYKCWNHIGNTEKVIGHITRNLEIDTLYLSYLIESFETDENCRQCKVLPLCMGGCVDIRVNYKNGTFPTIDCSKWKYYLEESLKEYYLYKTKKTSSE